jgi:intracellular multiplication protein IcmJ
MAPLILSVRRPTESASARQTSVAPQGSCRFCAAGTAKSQEHISCLDADGACPLCHLVRHLERPTIDEEAVLIWLPELTQAAVIAIVREAHRRLAEHGMLHLAAVGWPVASDAPVHADAREALAAIAVLRGRIDEAEARLGATSPKALAAALSRLEPAAYAERAQRLSGLRLMPLGCPRSDVYRDFLSGLRRG